MLQQLNVKRSAESRVKDIKGEAAPDNLIEHNHLESWKFMMCGSSCRCRVFHIASVSLSNNSPIGMSTIIGSLYHHAEAMSAVLKLYAFLLSSWPLELAQSDCITLLLYTFWRIF